MNNPPSQARRRVDDDPDNLPARPSVWVAVLVATTIAVAAVAAAVSLTVVAPIDHARPPTSARASTGPPSEPAAQPAPSEPAPSTPATSSPPPAPEVPAADATGSGRFRTATGRSTAGDGSRVVGYRVQVETSLDLDPAQVSGQVEQTLADRRGWTSTGHYTFTRSAHGALRVLIASPGTTDRLCAPLRTRGRLSCRNGDLVVINARRWLKGIRAYADLGAYRAYVVNHEVGHAIGRAHQRCPRAGSPAPVMQQQTISMDGCTPNPWPNPDAAR